MTNCSALSMFYYFFNLFPHYNNRSLYSVCITFDFFISFILKLILLTSGSNHPVRMNSHTLDLLRVSQVVSLALFLQVLQDHHRGHEVDDLPRGQDVQVGPGVLAPVSVHPFKFQVFVRRLRFGLFYTPANKFIKKCNFGKIYHNIL